jgi:pilus assembly protein CpaE
MEALRNPHRVDDLFLDRTMVKKTDKLMVLSAEEPLEEDAHFDPAALDAVLRILQQRFHYVIMDLPRRPGARYRQVLERSAIQIILATPTVAALRDVMRISHLIGREDLGQRALLIMNHTSPAARSEVPRTDFEKTIGRRVDYELPFSRVGLASDNGGEMLVEQDPAFAGAVRRVVDDLLGRSTAQEPMVKRLFRFRRS